MFKELFKETTVFQDKAKLKFLKSKVRYSFQFIPNEYSTAILPNHNEQTHSLKTSFRINLNEAPHYSLLIINYYRIPICTLPLDYLMSNILLKPSNAGDTVFLWRGKHRQY